MENKNKVQKKKSQHNYYSFNPSLLELENHITWKDKTYRSDNISNKSIVTVAPFDEGGNPDPTNLIAGIRFESDEERYSNTKKDLEKGLDLVYKDSQLYYKVYADNGDDTLGLTGYKMLKYISKSLTPNKTEVYLPRIDVMEKCGWKSRMNYHNAIVELLNKEFIYRKMGHDDVYYINVCKIFNGDRIPEFKKYRKFKEENIKDVELAIKMLKEIKENNNNNSV